MSFFKACLAVWCFCTGTMLPLCIVTASLAQLLTHPILSSTLWQTVAEKDGITYTVSPILLALTWNMKVCVLVCSLSTEHFDWMFMSKPATVVAQRLRRVRRQHVHVQAWESRLCIPCDGKKNRQGGMYWLFAVSLCNWDMREGMFSKLSG